MKTNHLVAQLKFSLSPSLTHSHTLSLISGFQILNLALIWPYFLSAPEPQVLPPSPPYAPAVLYAISSSKHVELSPAEGFLCMTSTFPFLTFQLKGTLKKCSLKQHFQTHKIFCVISSPCEPTLSTCLFLYWLIVFPPLACKILEGMFSIEFQYLEQCQLQSRPSINKKINHVSIYVLWSNEGEQHLSIILY